MPDTAATADAPPSGQIVRLSPPLLETRDLSLTLGGRRVLDGVRLAIRTERRTVIVGANGAGKSVLLRLMHGLITPSAGCVMWRGAPLDRTARRQQAMVFQRPIMLRRSARANLAFALAIRRVRRRERAQRIEEALHRARLTALADQPARVLSGGEQQRLALARALILEPTLLFLDEPTASLDPAATLAIENLVTAAAAGGTTICLVTHDRGQARRLADDVIVLSGGRIAESGPAARVLGSPQSEPARAWLEGRLYIPPTE